MANLIRPENMSPELIAKINAKKKQDIKEGKRRKNGEPVYTLTKKEIENITQTARRDALEWARKYYGKQIISDYGLELFVSALYLGLVVLERDFRDVIKKTKYKNFNDFLADYAEKVVEENADSVHPSIKSMVEHIEKKTNGMKIIIKDCETDEELPVAPFQKW